MGMREKDEVRITYLRPNEVLERRRRRSLIILPIGLIEWHGAQLPMGTDAITAETCALTVAHRLGGVVLPTLFTGTERERPNEYVLNFGLEDGKFVEGMDFPLLPYKSFYFREEIFALTVRNYIELAISHAYSLFYIINGHGAFNQNDVIKRLAMEYNDKQRKTRIMHAMSWDRVSCEKLAFGHAAVDETSYIYYLDKDLVDISQLPAKGTALKYSETGIVDSGVYLGQPGANHVLPESQDPRNNLTPEMGKRHFESAIREIISDIEDFFSGDEGRTAVGKK